MFSSEPGRLNYLENLFVSFLISQVFCLVMNRNYGFGATFTVDGGTYFYNLLQRAVRIGSVELFAVSAG